MPTTFTDVACTICGCVCDDLQVTVEGDRVIAAEGACELAQPWFFGQGTHQPPAAQCQGAEIELDRAIELAAKILSDSQAPLIYGLSRSSTPGQRSAIALGEWLGGTVDTTASRCHAPSIQALQFEGEATCTLGEIRNRADLVIYWGSNPAVSHPRHGERYATTATGRWISHREQRYVVVADVSRSRTAEQADLYLPIEPDRDFEALNTLRQLIRGIPVSDQGCGAPLELLQDLARRMKECRCGIVFFGLGLTRQDCGVANVRSLLSLVRELNDHTRFYARRMRIQGDVAGADSVLCWQTGYPFSVNFSRGYPRYSPGEYSANELLERQEVDACVLVGSEGVEWFTDRARAALSQIPVIALDYPGLPSAVHPLLQFTTAAYGIHVPGTAYRMDEVPIPLKAILPQTYPSDAEILDRILQQIRQQSTATV